VRKVGGETVTTVSGVVIGPVGVGVILLSGSTGDIKFSLAFERGAQPSMKNILTIAMSVNTCCIIS
jgi:hypothetical protein